MGCHRRSLLELVRNSGGFGYITATKNWNELDAGLLVCQQRNSPPPVTWSWQPPN